MGGGGQGVRDPSPLENHKNIGSFSNTCLDPLEKHQVTKPALLGVMEHHQPARGTSFKWRFASGPIMVPAFSGI